MQASKAEAEKDQVVVPTTMEEYCMKPKKPVSSSQHDNIEIDDFYDDDVYDMDDDDEEEDEEDFDDDDDDGDDSQQGNGNSGRVRDRLH